MNKGLLYAEKDLGVHTVYQEATAALQNLDEVVTDLDKAQDERRYLAEDIAQWEADLTLRERGANSEMSATAFEQYLKLAKQNDKDLKRLRQQMIGLHSRIQGLEYDMEMLKLKVRVKVARMNELGGYFAYLVQLKAETPTTPTAQENQA